MTKKINRIRLGVLVVVFALLSYCTGVLFGVIPLVAATEAYGGCGPVKPEIPKGLLSGATEYCWDGTRTVPVPLGIVFAFVFLAIFIAGIVLIITAHAQLQARLHKKSLDRRPRDAHL